MKKSLLILSLLVAAPAALAAAPPQPETLGTFGKWTAYRHFEGKNKPVCYMAAPPVVSSGKYKQRDPAFLLITHRPAEKAFNVVSFVAGYVYDEKKPVMVKIDKDDFIMVPAKDMAWTPNQKADDILTSAIQRGANLVITGTSSRGTITKDEFDLKGSAKAFETISKACTPVKKK